MGRIRLFFPDARTDARTDGGRRAARFSFEMLRSGGESRSGADGGSFGTELLGREGPVKLRKRALRFASHSAESMSGEEGKKKPTQTMKWEIKIQIRCFCSCSGSGPETSRG